MHSALLMMQLTSAEAINLMPSTLPQIKQFNTTILGENAGVGLRHFESLF